MPLELGLFLGAKRYGTGKQRSKNCLIVDLDRYRYQKFISDIAGQDISAHGGKPETAIRVVRDWLSAAAGQTAKLPGGAMLAKRYQTFADVLPAASAELGRQPDELTFTDYRAQVEEWLKANPWSPRRRGDFFSFGKEG